MKNIIFTFMLLFSSLTWANDQAVQTVQQEPAKNEWSEKGKNIGLAIAAITKELGVAAESFAKTDAGKIVFGVMAFKIIGNEAIDVLQIAASIVLTPILLWLAVNTHKKSNHAIRLKSRSYTQVPVLWGLYHQRRIETEDLSKTPSEGEVFISFVSTAAMFICAVLVIALAF